MDKIKKIKIKRANGTYTDYIPIGVDAANIEMANGESAQEAIDSKINKTDIIDNLESNSSDKVLSAKQGKVLNNKIIDSKEEVEYIFPKLWQNQYSQDVSIIKGYNKNILIDCGIVGNWNNILLMIQDNLISHFDYFIISHYDSDHIGNVNNLIMNGFIDSKTIVYLPLVPDSFSNKKTTETNIKTTLTSNNISYITPTENYILNINDDFSIKFGNLNKTYMEENYTNYNYCSMVCLIRHKNNYSFYGGDAGGSTFKYLSGINFVNQKVDLYKQAHHGIDVTNNFLLFDREMNPTFTVQMAGINDFIKNNFYCEETSFLINQGTNYYPTYKQSDYLKFNSNGFSMYNKIGKSYSASGQKIAMNLYVDINTTNEVQNGTQEYPFKELMQAIGYIENFPGGTYKIYLSDGSYGYSHEAGPTHAKNKININVNNNFDIILYGNSEDNTKVKLNDTIIYNSNVSFNDLTISLKVTDGILAKFSNIIINNCNITNEDETQTVHTGIIAHNSKISIYDSSISYANRGISVQYGSVISHKNVTFSNITYENIFMRFDEGSGFANGKELLTEASNVSPVQLNDNITQYKYLIIEYSSTDGLHNSLVMVNPTYTMKGVFKIPYINAQGSTYDKQAIIQLLRNDKIEIQQAWQTSISSGSNQTITKTTLDNPFTINSVIGLYNL